jgi:hypothetical protein
MWRISNNFGLVYWRVDYVIELLDKMPKNKIGFKMIKV